MKSHVGIGVSAIAIVLVACGVGDEATDETEGSEDNGGQAIAAPPGTVEDTFVSPYNPVGPRGAWTELKVSLAGTSARQTYLKFHVSNIPAGATNVRATVKVHAKTTTAGPVEIHRARTATWTEATLVESNAPGADPAVVASVVGTTAGAWATFDVSSAVHANGTYAFVIAMPTNGVAIFDSREAGA